MVFEVSNFYNTYTYTPLHPSFCLQIPLAIPVTLSRLALGVISKSHIQLPVLALDQVDDVSSQVHSGGEIWFT